MGALLTGIVKAPIWFLNWIPWMIFPMVLCMVFVGQGNGASTLIGWDLPSGARTDVTLTLAMVFVGLFCLMIEVWKATRTNTVAIADLIASTVLLVVGIVFYIILPQFGTGTFLALIVIQLIDVLTSMVVMVRAARRDFGITQGVVGGV